MSCCHQARHLQLPECGADIRASLLFNSACLCLRFCTTLLGCTFGLVAQGGEGCRDKKMMDRRDAAKYRNSKHKSVSKKSARVGKEGAARRQRGQKADK